MIGLKRQPLETPQPPEASKFSGRLVIIGILGIAFIAAGVSWWFRYNATHRAAKFWGTKAALLIRDAPMVTLFRKPDAELTNFAEDDPMRARFVESAFDISQAHGLVHLRNALLDDRSFEWPESSGPPRSSANDCYWLLSFHDRNNNRTALIFLSKDCDYATIGKPRFMGVEIVGISTKPISKGLTEYFADVSQEAETSAR